MRKTNLKSVHRKKSKLKQKLNHSPLPGQVRFGSFRQLRPISPDWGLERGTPIDRYYIEKFLSAHALDIRGSVLEIQSDFYTLKFGDNRVIKSDVLHAVEGNPHATIVADLARASHIPSNIFDCIILTQTLHFIYDVRAAIKTLWRILKPGGILLATFPGINKIDRYGMRHWGEHWRFTTLSAKRVFGEAFPSKSVKVMAYGNILTAIAFLHGLAAEELKQKELDYCDPEYELLITGRGVKKLKAQ